MQNQIEAILFYKNEPVSLKELAKILDKKESEVREGIDNLKKNLENRGLTLIESGEDFSLATSNDVSNIIEKIAKEELSKDIGKAGLETLSIILYQGPVARREIDYIRGVNSNFILRSLMMRGLVEKLESTKDGRSYLYRATIPLLGHLGIKSPESLPEFDRITQEIKTIKNTENTDAEN